MTTAVLLGTSTLRRSADGADVVGAPDLVVEVVSPSSVGKDTEVLPVLYHRAGIREYWVMDARADEVAFDIRHHTPDGYVPAVPAGGWLPSPVFGRRFRLERTPNPIGLWRYTLHVAPLDPAQS